MIPYPQYLTMQKALPLQPAALPFYFTPGLQLVSLKHVIHRPLCEHFLLNFFLLKQKAVKNCQKCVLRIKTLREVCLVEYLEHMCQTQGPCDDFDFLLIACRLWAHVHKRVPLDTLGL